MDVWWLDKQEYVKNVNKTIFYLMDNVLQMLFNFAKFLIIKILYQPQDVYNVLMNIIWIRIINV